MSNKVKFSFLFFIFLTILSINIPSLINFNVETNIENSYETTDESYFSFSDYDDVNRTVSIASNPLKSFDSNTLVLPSTHTLNDITYEVTTIAVDGFSATNSIESLVLPSELEVISTLSFKNCINLKEVIFTSENLKIIGMSAFDGCISLESMIVPNGVQTIEMYAFSGCSNLKVLYLPSTLTTVGNGSFSSTTNLQSIYINSIISFANANVFDSSSCPIIVSNDVLSYYTEDKLNRYEDITYIVEIDIDFNGGSNGSLTPSTVYKLFGLEFGYAVNQTTGLWNYEENDNFTDLPSNLTKVEHDQELRLSHYSYDSNKVSFDLVVTQEIIELGLVAQYEGVFTTIYDDTNNTHIITGISNSFKGNILDLKITNSYYDGTNFGTISEIAPNAFEGLTFSNISFENGLTKIGEAAFKDVKLTANSVITIPESIDLIGANAFDSISGVSCIYLNDSADYQNDVFNNLDSLIIAPSEEVYNDLINDIDNINFTYLVYITLDFNEGTHNGSNTEVLTRLNNESLRYIQKTDLTWYESDGYKLPVPTKTNYLFTEYSLKNTFSIINEDSVFTTNTTLIASYNLQIIKSQSSDNSISGNLYVGGGIDPNTTLSINLNNSSSLSNNVSQFDIYGIYSIDLLLNGEAYDPGFSSYTLSILLPEDMGEVVKYTIYMLEDGKLAEINGEYQNGYIVFELNSLSDIALVNQAVIVTLPSVNESILTAILIMSLVNIIEFILIFKLNKGKRKTIVASCNLLPLFAILSVNNISVSILVALSATAIAQAVYISYLYITRNNTILIKEQVASLTENTVSLEELEDIINESRKSIEELNAEYLSKEEYREFLSLDDESDEEVVEDVEEDEVDDEDEVRTRLNSSGQLVVIRFKKSFSARLNLTEDINKDYHTIIKNKLLSYKKVNCRISWNHEAYNFGRNQAAKVNLRGKTLFVYLPLNPNDYLNSKVSFKDCSYIKKYEQIPFRLKIKSKKAVKNALELIELVMKNFNTSEKKKFEVINYYQKNRGFEKLLQEELIKEVISAEEYNELKELNKVIEDDNIITPPTIKLAFNEESKRRNVMVRRTIFVEDDNNNVVPKNVMVRRSANDLDTTSSHDLIIKSRPLVRPKNVFKSSVNEERKPLVRPNGSVEVAITSPFKLFEEKQRKAILDVANNVNKKVN